MERYKNLYTKQCERQQQQQQQQQQIAAEAATTAAEREIPTETTAARAAAAAAAAADLDALHFLFSRLVFLALRLYIFLPLCRIQI